MKLTIFNPIILLYHCLLTILDETCILQQLDKDIDKAIYTN